MHRQYIFSKTAVQSVQYQSISVSIFGLLDSGLEDISKSNGYLVFMAVPWACKYLLRSNNIGMSLIEDRVFILDT